MAVAVSGVPVMRPISAMFVLALVTLTASTALADKPDRGRKDSHESGRGERDDGRGGNINVQINVDDRGLIRNHYDQEFEHGRCPPGLAKKHNGCMPPGQAKRWSRGYPLPRDVIFHDLPYTLRGQLHPPPGARYVRVDSDILLLAIGTGMVLDALEGLGRN